MYSIIIDQENVSNNHNGMTLYDLMDKNLKSDNIKYWGQAHGSNIPCWRGCSLCTYCGAWFGIPG